MAESSTGQLPAAPARTPENLRKRQRDRLSPRGRFTNTVGLAAEPGAGAGTGDSMAPAELLGVPSRSKTTGSRPQDWTRKRQLPQGGLRKEGSVAYRGNKDTENSKFDITPDGGSAGREGRQFTVAKVGNNGKIYLRPTIRPAAQRYPAPSFVFPVTPPSTAGLDALVPRGAGDAENQQHDSVFTPTPTPSTPSRHPGERYAAAQTPSQLPRHRRALSESTADGQHHPIDIADSGDFKVVIERPGAAGASKSAYDGGVPTIEVPIPSYRLGTPRFSTRGTAFFRASSYSTTDDMRSSIFSQKDMASRRDQSSHRPTRIISRRHSDASPQPHIASVLSQGIFDPASMPSPATVIKRHHKPIIPEMYDDLTFKPACDHPSVVRYSVNGGIRAATPARLVAEITSPTFVDYDLLSDFFLTYRSFLEAGDLLRMLIARLRWALARGDEIGTIVRVRTFVALRHWILNYFLDDFVLEYELRKSFCDLLNNFVDELCQDPVSAKVPLKIVGEIKKCWRRVCALYWDGPDFDLELGPEAPIAPGGIAGHRDPNLDPSFWEGGPEGPPRLEGIIEPEFTIEHEHEHQPAPVQDRNFFADVSRTGRISSFIAPQPVIQHPQPRPHSHESGEPPLSPTSIVSEDFVSCSFPSRARIPNAALPLGAHPVQVGTIHEPAQPVATTPKALTGKRVRPAPSHSHKRSGSFSDSIRDNRVPQQPVQKVVYKSTELLLALPYAGSLVRGNVLPPAEGYVDVVAPGTPAEVNRQLTLPRVTVNQKAPAAMSGPGMKKLLGSVRRALSARAGSTPNASPTLGSFPNMPPLGVRGATVNRLPGTAVVPQARSKEAIAHGEPRIDLLGAEVAEHFKQAVREEADIEFGGSTEHRSSQNTEPNPDVHLSPAPGSAALRPPSPQKRRVINSEMTTGSKSILIVDGTAPGSAPVMSGALSFTRSIDTFTDGFIQPSTEPTPPTTPPGRRGGTPRRSSHLLGQQLRTNSFERVAVPLVVDPQISQAKDRIMDRGHTGQYSMGPSYKSRRSASLRRYASFQSGITRGDTRSFDATTLSAESNTGSSPAPRPLRVLRRRPGGDLRAVSRVGQLNNHPLRRTASTGSLAYSDSMRSSYLLDEEADSYVEIGYNDARQSVSRRFSLGALAEAPPAQNRISLFSTHSSQPNMRPSFEKEAQLLAQIPDDDDDDGGVEAALLKLEGKFEQRRSDSSKISIPRDMPAVRDSFGVPIMRARELASEPSNVGKHIPQEEPVIEVSEVIDESEPLPDTYHPKSGPFIEELKPTVYKPTGLQEQECSQAPSRSVESYSSIPLLDRESTYDGLVDAREARGWSDISILRDSSSERQGSEIHVEPEHASYEFVEKPDVVHEEEAAGAKAHPDSVDHSFLESDSGDRSDLSSEMSVEVISPTEYTGHDSLSTSTFPPLGAGSLKEMELPTHPLHQPSTPSVNSPANQASNSNKRPHIGELVSQPRQKVVTPPTPEITPTAATGGFNAEQDIDSQMNPLRSRGMPLPSRKTSAHLPFILAFDSQVLAQQFTLIEKDALNEIDWKDLIEMRWKQISTESRSWVEFLRSTEPKGIEVVIARFNIMVKWAMSEIVLTQDLDERVLCITKYIHVAAHCRKLRNFATMTQLTVALTSKDVSRLTNTWAHVSANDLATLHQLEALVTPSSNFHSLRAEMECAGVDQGCIPFVGIYTHDLLVNSERPSQIASTPITEPLVNFEKKRTDATIVKNLLRLLEASLLYRFLPIEGITERCLWMAALSDEEITRYGKMIQP